MSLRQLPYTIVDAFTKNIFAGNPASVIVLDAADPLPDETMQLLGREFNLSETAFVRRTDNPDRFHLRWFTPAAEVALCGHATLASSFVIVNDKTADASGDKSRTITFTTRWAGDLIVSGTPGGILEMQFPAGVPEPPTQGDLEQRTRAVAVKAFPEAGVAEAQLVQTVLVGPPGKPYGNYLLIHIDDSLDLANLKVKPSAFVDLVPFIVVIVTNVAPSELKASGVHFVSRVFGPLVGIDEDPVTGSAHSVLAPYWAQKLGVSGQSLTAKQVSPRGGDVEVEWVESEKLVKVRGHAVIAAAGNVNVPQ